MKSFTNKHSYPNGEDASLEARSKHQLQVKGLLNVDWAFGSVSQENWGVRQEEASWKETDRNQNPCAQHSLPSLSQGTSRTFLVPAT